MNRLHTAIATMGVAALAACTPDSTSMLAPSAESANHLPDGTITISEGDVTRQPHNTPPTDNWVLYTRDAGTGAFEVGPETPPLGVGSLQLGTPGNNDKVYLFNYDHISTPLTSITNISYATYRLEASTTGHPGQQPALNLQVDYNGSAPGGFTTLVFEPLYTYGAAAEVEDEWQNWDADGSAKWWSTGNIPGVCSFDCFVSWSDIVAANPDAVITGGVGVNQGGGNPGLAGAVDALSISYTGHSFTYDFEPYRVATTEDQCKDGGWANVRTAEGEQFTNQGQCVSYTKTSP